MGDVTIESKIEVTMVNMFCYRCGIPFAITEDFNNHKRDDHKKFYCPRGHHMHYPDPKERNKSKCENSSDSPKPKRNRDADAKKIRELHELEQAEARLADKAKLEVTNDIPTLGPEPELKTCDDPAKVIEWCDDGHGAKAKCRLCSPIIDGKGFRDQRRCFRHQGHLRRHMREKHQLNLTPDQCQPPRADTTAKQNGVEGGDQ